MLTGLPSWIFAMHRCFMSQKAWFLSKTSGTKITNKRFQSRMSQYMSFDCSMIWGNITTLITSKNLDKWFSRKLPFLKTI